jgi:hypothetical protein
MKGAAAVLERKDALWVCSDEENTLESEDFQTDLNASKHADTSL